MLTVKQMLAVGQQVETFQRNVQQRAGFATPEMSARLSRIYQAAPGMSPTAVAALALSGVPEDQIFRMYAIQQRQLVAKAQVPSRDNDWSYEKEQPGWHPPMQNPVKRQAEQDKLIAPTAKAGVQSVGPVSRAEYSSYMFDQLKDSGSRAFVENNISDAVGWTAKNVVVPVFNAGSWVLDKFTPDVVSDNLTDIARGTTRWGFASVQWVPEFMEAITYGWLSNPEDAPAGLRAMMEKHGALKGVGMFIANAQRSTELGEGLYQMMSTGEVDTGSGFYMGGDVEAEADRRKFNLRGTFTGGPDMQSKPKSFGGSLAELGVDLKIWDRDSSAYSIASGTVDMAVEIVFDPTTWMPIGAGNKAVRGLAEVGTRDAAKFADGMQQVNAARAAGNSALVDNLMRETLRTVGVNTSTMTKSGIAELFARNDPAKVAAVSFMRQEAGIVREGGKEFVVLPEFAKFLTTGQGRTSINRLVEINDADDIMELFKWRIGPKTANDIANADNPETVIRALVRGMADPAQDAKALTRQMPHLGLFGVADKKLWVQRRMAPYTRLGNLMPNGSVLDMENPVEFIRTADTLMRVLPTNVGFKGGRYGEAYRKSFINRYIDAFANGDIERVEAITSDFAELMESMLVRLGYDSVTAQALTRTVKNQDAIGSMRWMDQLQGIEPVNTAPILAAQLFQSATVIDPAQLLRVVRESGRFRAHMRNGAEYNVTLKKYDRLNNKHRQLLDDGDVEAADKVADEISRINMTLTKATRAEGAMTKPDDEFALTMLRASGAVTDTVLQFWKSAQLLRFAYLLRTVPDDAAKAYFSGAFRGPMDALGAILASFDSLAKRGVGRYLSGPDHTEWVRSAKGINKLEAKMDAVRIKIASRDPLTQQAEIDVFKRELADLENEADALFANFEATTESLGAVLVSKNRTDALNLVDRERFASQVQRGGHVMARKDNAQQVNNWVRGVMERVSFLSNDEPSRMIARAYVNVGVDPVAFPIAGVSRTLEEHLDVLGRGSFDKIMANYFYQGPGKPTWVKFATASSRRGEDMNPADLGDALTWTREVMREMSYTVGQLSTSAPVPQLDNLLFEAVDMDMMRAVATGRFNGKRIYEVQRGRGGVFDRKFDSNSEFAEHVLKFKDSDASPVAVYASATGDISNDPAKLQLLGSFYQYMVGLPEDILVRDPLYRRVLWKQTAQLIRLASKDEAASIVAAARKAQIDDDLLELIIINSKVNMSDATAKEVMELANAAALDFQKDVLFDSIRRGSTADATRRIVAFGDAWYEGFKQWGTVVTRQRGKPIKSLMKGIEGGQDATVFGPDESYVWDPETGEEELVPESKPPGVFYRDPTTGQYGYNLPFSQQISKHLLGAFGVEAPGMSLFVPLKNLNMQGEISPGLGPIGSILVNSTLSNSPRFDFVNDFINPFGAPARASTDTARAEGLTPLMPGYLVKALPALANLGPLEPAVNFFINLTSNPWWLNFQNNTMKQLMSTGNYSSTDADSSRLLRDTEKAAAIYGLFFSFAQFVGPGAPTARKLAQVQNKETGYVDINVSSYFLIDDLNRTATEFANAGEPPHKALEATMIKWGPNIFMYAEPNTVNTYPGSESTEGWWDWYRTGKSEQFVKEYATVGAFFGASSDEFSLEVRGQLQRNGLIKPKQPAQLAAESRLNVAYYLYNRFREMLPAENLRSREQKLALAAYADELETTNQISLDDQTSRQRRKKQLVELQGMFESYTLGEREYAEILESDMGYATMQYMEFRREAQEQSVGRFGLGSVDSWATSNGGAVLRAGMRERANYLVQGYLWTENGWVKEMEANPGFGRLYSFVLEREMTGERDLEELQRVEFQVSGQQTGTAQTGGR